MSLSIASLNSGSNGNCYYVGNSQEAILVDAGISCREIERRLKKLALPVERIKAVFISHEHTDHIKGIEVLARKHRLPVYITPATLRSGALSIEDGLLASFRANEEIRIGGLAVRAFTKFHDAADPHSFVVSGNGITVGVFTDIGSVCSNLVDHFKQCHAMFLETNYDERMLEEGHYPFYLKNRIRGTHGHLSNHQALDLFRKHRSPFLSHVLLAHLSKDNNSPQLVQNLFEAHAGRIKVAVASRDYETEVYTITGELCDASAGNGMNETVQLSVKETPQLSLF